MAMATDCQKVRKTTLLTTTNLGRGRMGASSSLVARNMSTRQYSAQNCTRPGFRRDLGSLGSASASSWVRPGAAPRTGTSLEILLD